MVTITAVFYALNCFKKLDLEFISLKYNIESM